MMNEEFMKYFPYLMPTVTNLQLLENWKNNSCRYSPEFSLYFEQIYTITLGLCRENFIPLQVN